MHLALVLVGLFVAADAEKPRKPSAIAPSLPALTKEEEQAIDDVIDRFILADTGRLRGTEAKKATEAFDKLGMEAVPALIRGLNKSARLSHSCPVLMIGKKLSKLLLSSDDEVLLEFARDEIGAGLTRSPHAGTLADLRFRVLVRKNALAKRPLIPPKGPSVLTTPELARAIPKLRGEPLQGVLRELGKRDDKDALGAIALAATSRDAEIGKLAREMLDLNLGRQSPSLVKERMEEGPVEVRRSAIRVAEKNVELTPAVIDRLTDDNAAVRADARAALKKTSGGKEDFGPAADATKAQQREAQKRWKEWWLKKTAE